MLCRVLSTPSLTRTRCSVKRSSWNRAAVIRQLECPTRGQVNAEHTAQHASPRLHSVALLCVIAAACICRTSSPNLAAASRWPHEPWHTQHAAQARMNGRQQATVGGKQLTGCILRSTAGKLYVQSLGRRTCIRSMTLHCWATAPDMCRQRQLHCDNRVGTEPGCCRRPRPTNMSPEASVVAGHAWHSAETPGKSASACPPAND